MNVYLLRHGIAEAYDPARFPDDSQRPLGARGHEQMAAVAQAMRRLDLAIDIIWTSPLVRTRQTAAAVATGLASDRRVHEVEHLAPDGDPRALMAELAGLDPRPANVLLVGHEPCLSGLLSVLASGGSAMQAKFKKGALAKLQLTGPIRFGQCATLLWLLPPNLLMRLNQARLAIG